MSTESPSIDAHELWKISNSQALAMVDQQLGPAAEWARSALYSYRLSAEFQEDWKTEVGHWLHAAQRFGFLERMVRPILGERDRPRTNQNNDLLDPRHLKLHQHLLAAMMCHYFTGIGWSFAGWDTEPPGPVDIDLALTAPGETLVEFQVKAPGQAPTLPDGRHPNGTTEDQLLTTMAKAVDQLPPSPARSVAMVGVYAQWAPFESLAGNPRPLLRHLYGPTTPSEGAPIIHRSSFGQFLRGRWNHVAGVLLMDVLRGETVVRYPCTVLLNPSADKPANADWFPRSRVLVLEGDAFRWIRGAPWVRRHGLPDGTVVERATTGSL